MTASSKVLFQKVLDFGRCFWGLFSEIRFRSLVSFSSFFFFSPKYDAFNGVFRPDPRVHGQRNLTSFVQIMCRNNTIEAIELEKTALEMASKRLIFHIPVIFSCFIFQSFCCFLIVVKIICFLLFSVIYKDVSVMVKEVPTNSLHEEK